MVYHFKVRSRALPADTLTPVSVYLKLRDLFPDALLLESVDYNGNENSYSYICCAPVAGIIVRPEGAESCLPDGTKQVSTALNEALTAFPQQFSFEPAAKDYCRGRLFGHINYDAVGLFEDIVFRERDEAAPELLARLHVYRYMIVFDHFHHTVYLTAHFTENEDEPSFAAMEAALRRPAPAGFRFRISGPEEAEETGEAYKEKVAQAIEHCRRGDIFQVVLSRTFSQAFTGDDFNVYRALRMVNPSPYLFYFDYGDYRLFGSSPETQLRVKDGVTMVYPIAGTSRRTGDETEDEELIAALMADPKEQAEHTMLVDLARNDLSKSHDEVAVESYKKVQRFAHVVHIVSEVRGDRPLHSNAIRMLADTFPAGTLSGAPKHRAMQLIDQYEHSRRGYYGGAIGFLEPGGQLNQAIMIRTFMSRNNQLHYRAGAGIVVSSVPENELQEIAHKLRGLRTAIRAAENIGMA
ncbi:anthranilate synthase component I family protein [Taibaiella helva]|uniref:anthranilate synthase component I family protein n=1 Tax=Taibaiella helva TaxID=2301235 RepID=UPI000E581FA7|nr:anthranilate synthase component I family protein [Taibaiella helva]